MTITDVTQMLNIEFHILIKCSLKKTMLLCLGGHSGSEGNEQSVCHSHKISAALAVTFLKGQRARMPFYYPDHNTLSLSL